MIADPAPFRSLLIALNSPCCRSVALSLIGFFSNDQIMTLSGVFQSQGSNNYFIQLIRNYNFMNNYLNRTDKSLYFTFYDQQSYSKIEIAQVAAIAQQNSNQFLKYHCSFDQIYKLLQQTLPSIVDDVDTLKNMISDPELPIPKLKRQTEGIYCSSPFQLFLVDCTFRDDYQEEFYNFQKLREFFNIQKQQEYIKQFISILRKKELSGDQLRKIMKLRYIPYQINANNFKQFLIEGNELHNFIASLFALTDTMVEAIHAYIDKIHDPLHRLIELLLRYSIYRNFVLGVEEYLAFIFIRYENVYHESIEEDRKKPKFRFWRPALTKWYLKMNHFHAEGMEVYMHCLTKLRNFKFIEQIKQQANEDQYRFSNILTKLELNHFQYTLAEKIFNGQLGTSSQLGLFFDSNPLNYEVLVMEFNEYLIDISINQQTVHWCGHSDHQLEQPYLLYQQKMLNLNQTYLQTLIETDQMLSKTDVQILVQGDLQYLSYLQIKNRTLKKMVCFVSEQFKLDGEHMLIYDFDEADRKLQYFNQKALILAQVDQNERPFFSIPPHCSADTLIHMIDTNDSENNNSDQQIYEYRSQASDQQKIDKKQGFMYESMEDEPIQTTNKKQPKSYKHFLQDIDNISETTPTKFDGKSQQKK